ncbi:MAG: hypothetical protein ACREOO_11245 [bacterium]
MKFYNIVTPKKYADSKGNEQTKWLPVGTLRVTDDNKRFIEWNATPDIVYMVVEQKSGSREASSKKQKDSAA